MTECKYCKKRFYVWQMMLNDICIECFRKNYKDREEDPNEQAE